MSVIDASERFAKKPIPPRTLDQVRACFAPSVKALPFAGGRRDEHGWPETFWNDVPTVDPRADYKRGEHFAEMTIAALMVDYCGANPLGRIFDSIIDDAVKRRVKGGKGSRTMPYAVHGYLSVLSDFIANRCRPGRHT